MKTIHLFLTLLFVLSSPLASQTTSSDDETAEEKDGPPFVQAVEREFEATLAMTRADYPVTPGDVYLLSYHTAGQTVTTTLHVTAACEINLGLLGSLDAKDTSFQDAREAILARVTESYRNSFPSLTIRSVGRFEIHVSGHVAATGFRQVSGLSRLHDALEPLLLPHSSQRTIRVAGGAGARSFDLFAALRHGASSQNPYLRPRDRVVVQRAAKVVRVEGAVRRPGSYELLPGETLSTLLDEHAAGYLTTAAPARLFIDRSSPEGGQERLTREESRGTLRDGDLVHVPDARSFLPAVTFVGAVGVPAEGAARGGKTGGSPGSTLVHRFRPGATLAQALQDIHSHLLPGADLSRAQYYRTGSDQPTPVDLFSLLYAHDPPDDLTLRAGDRILVPYGVVTVRIRGEVSDAGQYDVGPLTRLSAALEPHLIESSSTRAVEVVSAAGSSRRYDLYRAQRFGELENDPYLSPGDTITVARAERTVELTGEVVRPGVYHLLSGERLDALVRRYGGGATLDADPGRLTLSRTSSDAAVGREIIELDLHADAMFELRDGDVVAVPSETDLLPLVTLEGAVHPNGSYHRALVRIAPGQTLREFVREHESRFPPVANLGAATLTRRGGTTMEVDAASLLDAENPPTELVPLAPGDVLLVPFRRPVVIVSGAVARPGSFEYVPGRRVDYYVNLAGGFDPGRTWFPFPSVDNSEGTAINAGDPVPAGATIVVPANNPFYVLQLGTVISVTSGLISLILLLSQ